MGLWIFVVVTTMHVILDLSLPNAIDGILWRPLLCHLMQTSGTSEPWTSAIDAMMIVLIEGDDLSADEFLTVEQQSATCVEPSLKIVQAMRVAIWATAGPQPFKRTKRRAAPR